MLDKRELSLLALVGGILAALLLMGYYDPLTAQSAPVSKGEIHSR